MFEFVRSHKRLLQFLLVILIFPSFVFVGVQGYTQFSDETAVPVAEVDGRGILRAEWEQAHQRSVERLRQQVPGADVKLFDTPEMRRQTLESLVRDRVLLAAASSDHLLPGDERLARLFKADPQLAGLRNPDGTVNRERLAAQGLSSEAFAQQLRLDYGMGQVLGSLQSTAVMPSLSTRSAIDAFLQRREVQWELFPAAAHGAQIKPTDEELAAYFKTHAARFQRPEQAQIEYAVLDLASIRKAVPVSEDDLRRFYAENESRYTVAEERRASHILIKAEKEQAAAQRQKARERAEALLAELRRAPARFADLARQQSEDPGSAAQGGDLDFFARGAMVKPFEDAVFGMKKGEISPVIETDFGFHIIQLTAVRGGEKRPFEAVRAEIEAQVRQQGAQSRFAEAAEQFTNGVFEQPDSLQPVLERLGLDKRTATVQRTPAPGATGALASVKLLEAVFSSESVVNKRNTEAVDLGDNQLVSARVVSHTPARVPELPEVVAEVRSAVVRDQAAQRARSLGQERLQSLKAAAGGAPPLARSGEVSRVQPQGLPRRVVDAILQMPATSLPAPVGIDLGDEGYVVARVMKVLPAERAQDAEAAIAPQLSQAWGAAEAAAYYEMLKRRFKAEVKPAAKLPAASGAPAS
jgi:peptidyl-prolyl cis-trans isomerase D